MMRSGIKKPKKIRPRKLFQFFFSFFLIFVIIYTGALIIGVFTDTSEDFELFYTPLYYSTIIGITGFNLYRFLLLAKELHYDKTLFGRLDFSRAVEKGIPIKVTKKVIQASILAGLIFNGMIIFSILFDWGTVLLIHLLEYYG